MIPRLEVTLAALVEIPAELVLAAVVFAPIVAVLAAMVAALDATWAETAGSCAAPVVTAALLALMPASRAARKAGLVETIWRLLIYEERVAMPEAVVVSPAELVAIPAVLVIVPIVLAAIAAFTCATVAAS